MSELRNNLIKLAYHNPDLRRDLISIIKEAEEGDKKEKGGKDKGESKKDKGKKDKGKDIPTREQLYEMTFTNPETGNEVNLETLEKAEEGSKARKKYEQVMKKWEKAKNEAEGGDEDEDKEEGESKTDKAKQKMKEVAEKSKGKIKDKIQNTKDKVKGAVKRFFAHEATLGDLADAMLTMTQMFFEPKEGKELMDSLIDDLGMNDPPEKFEEALSELKAAEMAGTLDEETRDVMMKNLGLDPKNSEVNAELIRGWFEAAPSDEEIPDDVLEELYEFFLPLSDDHLQILNQFIDPETGKIDIDELRKQLSDGIPEDFKDLQENRPDSEEGSDSEKSDKDKKEDSNSEKQKKESSLRKDLIKLAYQNPNMRPDLLPLLKS